MKLKFKTQDHQTAAVIAVVNCFRGQLPARAGVRYRLKPGVGQAGAAVLQTERFSASEPGDGQLAAFRNADISLAERALLGNIQDVQRQQGLPVSAVLVKTGVCGINLDIEMETGTGKTYCYIKTIFELNKQYGWGKFIIVVPSIAIREGVARSLEITADHFLETYHRKARFFIYNSRSLHHLESFSSDAGINVMIINVQAFNAAGKDARRIYEKLDDFQSRRPIDVISANRPILILDEPQKMEGGKTLDSLVNFKPLMVLRYSATHKKSHNKIYRLDALDAYNQKLVKKIAVRGISVKGLAGTNAYLYLQSIEISTGKAPEARVELEQKLACGEIRRVVRKLTKGDRLLDLSNGLEQYRAYVVADIDASSDVLSFSNGVELSTGEAIGDINESALRRIQIREAIKAHFEKEQVLFRQGIKVLTLFFIDEVVRYRDYSTADGKGEYARIFEEEYQHHLNEVLDLTGTDYIEYLKGISAADTHRGYFSIDRKTKHLIDPVMGRKAAEADDVDAYDLILKDRERLLSLKEPVRFIFSHSALREGWDNPNIFVICTLKHSDNTISRRQEVGRGLRLCVNQHGERMDHPAIVHDINVLTVVASESYKDFVAALQKDISESQLPEIGNDRRPKNNPLNGNLHRQVFRTPWHMANDNAAIRVDFDADELVKKAVAALDAHLRVTPLQYTIQYGEQVARVDYKGINGAEAFELKDTMIEMNVPSIHSDVKYDLLGKLAEGTQLTRLAVADILRGINPTVFSQFKTNPERFIIEATRLINEQTNTAIIEHLAT